MDQTGLIVVVTLYGLVCGHMTEGDTISDNSVSTHREMLAENNLLHKNLQYTPQIPGNAHQGAESQLLRNLDVDNSGKHHSKFIHQKLSLLDILKNVLLQIRRVEAVENEHKLEKHGTHRTLDRRRRDATDSNSVSQSDIQITGSGQSADQLKHSKTEEINAKNSAEKGQKDKTNVSSISHSNHSEETAVQQMPHDDTVAQNNKLSPADTVKSEHVDNLSDSKANSVTQIINSGSDVMDIKSKVSSGENRTLHSMAQDGNVPSINMTVMMNKYVHKSSHTRDVTSATLCVSAVLILLFGVVLYSRMWKKRDQWLTLEEVLQNQAVKSQLPHHGKISLKDLMESKLRFVKAQFRRLHNKSRKSSNTVRKNGSYKEVQQSEDTAERSGSEDELYTR